MTYKKVILKMEKVKKFIVFLISIVILNISSLYASDDYICQIEKLSLVSMNEKNYKAYEKNYIGQKFTVDRINGIMAGSLKNSYLTKPQVIDYGSQENSYKVITTMTQNQGLGKGSNMYALNILEYIDGDKKPFVFLQNEIIFFGTCIHF